MGFSAVFANLASNAHVRAGRMLLVGDTPSPGAKSCWDFTPKSPRFTRSAPLAIACGKEKIVTPEQSNMTY